MPGEVCRKIARKLGRWYDANARDLPWRRTADPYRIWLSEVVLQQTRVQQGLPYYHRLVEAFPDVCTLARAEEAEVLRLWKGLGYYRRARHLHRAAQTVCFERDGQFPQTLEGLESLPGVGAYTAAAIASFAFGMPAAVVDGNVLRVVARLTGSERPVNEAGQQAQYRRWAEQLLDREAPGRHNQAMMELGALVCTPRDPQCEACPVSSHCRAFEEGRAGAIPVKNPPPAKKKRYLHYLLLRHRGRIAMRKRPDGDIWAGLYEPVPAETDTPRWATPADFGLSPRQLKDDFQALGQAAHTLTHRQLQCVCYQASWKPPDDSLPEPLFWVAEEEAKEMGTPKIIATFLNRFL
jgi:A/G-specific adenine glycosylase